MFFPEPTSKDSKMAQAAISICQKCEVRAECLAHAINNNEVFGIWGGKTERARKKIARMVPVNVTVEAVKSFL